MSFRISGLTTAPWAALAALALASTPALAGPESGMRAARDAQTGQVRAPTAEESRTLDAAAARTRAAKGAKRVGMASGAVNPQSTMTADGAVQLELDESTLSYSVARRNADGTIEMVCVEGSEAANKALKAPKFASRPVMKAAKEQQK